MMIPDMKLPALDFAHESADHFLKRGHALP